MSHVILRPKTDAPGALQLIINGVDYSNEIYRDFELVEVGDDPSTSEVGFRVTFAVSRLDLGGDEDVRVTDHFRSVAQRVHATVQVTDEVDKADEA